MKWFLMGCALVYNAGAAWLLWDADRTWSVLYPAPGRALSVFTLAAKAAIIPLLCAWVAAECARSWRRPALFVRAPGRGRKLALGMLAGAAGLALAGAAMIWLDGKAPEALMTGGPAAATAFAGLAVLPRARRGVCRGCGYDLSSLPAPGQPGFGRCPECGLPVMG